MSGPNSCPKCGVNRWVYIPGKGEPPFGPHEECGACFHARPCERRGADLHEHTKRRRVELPEVTAPSRIGLAAAIALDAAAIKIEVKVGAAQPVMLGHGDVIEITQVFHGPAGVEFRRVKHVLRMEVVDE